MDDSDDEILILAAAAVPLVLGIINKRKKTRRRKRALWSQKWLQRRDEGRGIIHMLENELRLEDADLYKMFLRMCGDHFDELLAMVIGDIDKQHTNMRQCVTGAQRYSEDLELDDAVHTAILTLKESFEGQMTADNIEVGICDASGFRRLDPAHVKDYLANIP